MKRLVLLLLVLASPSWAAEWWRAGSTSGIAGTGILPTTVRLESVVPIDSSLAPSGGAVDMQFPACAQHFAPLTNAAGNWAWGDETIVWPWRFQSNTSVRENFTARAVRVAVGNSSSGSTDVEVKVFVRTSSGGIDSTLTGRVSGPTPFMVRVNNILFVKVRAFGSTTVNCASVYYW